MYTHRHKYTSIYVYTHTHTLTYTHVDTRTYTLTHVHPYSLTLVHTYTRKHIHTFTCPRHEVPVTSGVPQGSVLGPCLLPFVRLTKFQTKLLLQLVYFLMTSSALKPKTNTAALQEDLHKVDKWAKNWNMEFNLERFHVFPVTRKKNCR